MARKIVIFGWAESEHIRRWASGLQTRGFDVLVVSLGGEPLDNVETYIIPASGRQTPILAAGTAARIARQFQPDLAHVHYASTFGWWGMRSRVRPLVVSVWGSDIVRFPSNWLARRYLKKVLSTANHLTVTSRFLQAKVTTFLPGAQNKLDVIPFGVDVPGTLPKMPEGSAQLCFLKSHKSVYAPDILIRAFAEARQDIPSLRLIMAGGGPMTGQLRELVSRLKLNEQVHFPGVLKRVDVYRLLADSHMLVMPSLEEAFGVAALEAAACGRPVIASDVGGISEVVVNGQTGVLVPAGDVSALSAAIVNLAKNRLQCEQMGKAGYEFVKKHYLWERSLDLMADLYERLINEKT